VGEVGQHGFHFFPVHFLKHTGAHRHPNAAAKISSA